jgi:hypothetical protein
LDRALEALDIGYFTWWSFPKKAWLIIIAELGVITSLSVSLYVTYLSNVYFQTYVDSLSPILVPVLSVAFGISSASIATYLYLGMKRVRTSQETQIPTKNRARSRKSTKRLPHQLTAQPKVADPPPTTPAKLKPIAPIQSHAQPQKSLVKERDDHPSSPESRKQS